MKGTDIPADFHYYNWVDQFDISRARGQHAVRHRVELGLAARAESADTGSGRRCACRIRSASIRAGMDGRIDDPNAGWKGRGLYANYGTHFVWHIEGGKGTKGKLVKFQIRPDPLAR